VGICLACLYSEYFEVDAGVLYVARPIDRDKLCDADLTSVCRLTVDVTLVRPVALFRALQVHIDVLDLNDNDPKFNVEDFVLNVPESVSPGTEYAVLISLVTVPLYTAVITATTTIAITPKIR